MSESRPEQDNIKQSTSQEGQGEAGGTLPNYSNRVQKLLDEGRILEDFETAH